MVAIVTAMGGGGTKREGGGGSFTHTKRGELSKKSKTFVSKVLSKKMSSTRCIIYKSLIRGEHPV